MICDKECERIIFHNAPKSFSTDYKILIQTKSNVTTDFKLLKWWCEARLFRNFILNVIWFLLHHTNQKSTKEKTRSYVFNENVSIFSGIIFVFYYDIGFYVFLFGFLILLLLGLRDCPLVIFWIGLNVDSISMKSVVEILSHSHIRFANFLGKIRVNLCMINPYFIEKKGQIVDCDRMK